MKLSSTLLSLLLLIICLIANAVCKWNPIDYIFVGLVAIITLSGGWLAKKEDYELTKKE